MQQADIGVIGLTVMGANLARNFESHGFSVAVYNRTTSRTDAFAKEQAGKNFIPSQDLATFVESLSTPRKVLMMVKAGEAVDSLIDQLLPLLSNGDILIDGGNSHFNDTNRRVPKVEQAGKLFVGMGVSGGEEGALHGPALMPGGSEAAWPILQPMLEAISAKFGPKNEPCCSWIGKEGAGHFVKMVHNGIEYADMQLISESYSMMRDALGMTPEEIKAVFLKWNEGPLKSYLIEITAKIFDQKDSDPEGYLVDHISDVAGQKGTGKWLSQTALDLGVAIPTITEAVNVRFMSSLKTERAAAHTVLAIPPSTFTGNKTDALANIEAALYAAKIIAYAQGLAMLQTASTTFDWQLNISDIIASWRSGCIIRAELLSLITEAYRAPQPAANLMLEPVFRNELLSRYTNWKDAIVLGVQNGIPLFGFMTALAYFEAYRSTALPTNLIQAQRDFFGAHTYERIDKSGFFHTEWEL